MIDQLWIKSGDILIQSCVKSSWIWSLLSVKDLNLWEITLAYCCPGINHAQKMAFVTGSKCQHECAITRCEYRAHFFRPYSKLRFLVLPGDTDSALQYLQPSLGSGDRKLCMYFSIRYSWIFNLDNQEHGLGKRMTIIWKSVVFLPLLNLHIAGRPLSWFFFPGYRLKTILRANSSLYE